MYTALQGTRYRWWSDLPGKGMLTHGSLFAGIGGFDLGFQWAGIETVWQVEIDEYCRQVLAKHFPEAERFSDIRDCGAHNLKPVDVISGGFPCQPWSVAGQQGGTEDDRNLWPEMFRVIGELRPRWVVAENVPHIDTMGYLDVTIDDLESLGYEVRPLEIPSAAIGRGHRRIRDWIIAYSEKNGRSGAVCSNLENSKEPSWARLEKPSGTLDSRLSIFNEFEKRVGKPAVLRVDDGLPNRVDRLGAIGNAIDPQIAEIIGRRLVEIGL